MDEARIGSVVRALRIRRRLTQAELATQAEVARVSVSRLERGLGADLRLRTIRRICAALEIRLELDARWRGGDLERHLTARHSAMAEELTGWLLRRPDWTVRPEVSFSIWGERGVVDLIAWHAARRTMLLIELKTEIVDVGDLMATADRRRRLAPRIASELGWRPIAIGYWVAVAESTTNARRVRDHRAVLRTAFPSDWRAIRAWLREPVGPMAGLSLRASRRLPSDRNAIVKRVGKPRRPRVGLASGGG